MKPVREPLISVIIPVYNLGKYLQETLDSVLAQTYRHFEIVLVDDGSTDCSREIILKSAQQYPEVIRYAFQENRGASAARNRGIELATGDWIALLDGDDIWKPQKLERQIQFLQHNPYLNFVSAQAEIWGTQKLFHPFIPASPDVLWELLAQGTFITTSTVLIRAEIIKKETFDETVKYANDYELWLRLARKTQYFFIQEPLIFYRVRENSLTDTGKIFQLLQEIELVQRYIKTSDFSGEKLRGIQKRIQTLTHEASYFSIMNQKLCFKERLKITGTAILCNPLKVDSYRFFIQAFLPTRLNIYLSHLYHERWSKRR